MVDTTLLSQLVFGLPHAQPGGLTLTWLLFVVTILFSIPLSYSLACACRHFVLLGRVFEPGFVLLRSIPPLIVIFTVDFFLPISIFWKGIIALTLYSMSHLFPIYFKYVNLYPPHLIWVEKVHKIGALRQYFGLWATWVFKKSFPAVHTHLVSLFKDTSIVILIGMLELSAVTSLMSSRSYQFSDWMEIFFLCSVLYFVNVQIVNAICWAGNRFAFETNSTRWSEQ